MECLLHWGCARWWAKLGRVQKISATFRIAGDSSSWLCKIIFEISTQIPPPSHCEPGPSVFRLNVNDLLGIPFSKMMSVYYLILYLLQNTAFFVSCNSRVGENLRSYQKIISSFCRKGHECLVRWHDLFKLTKYLVKSGLKSVVNTWSSLFLSLELDYYP